MIVNSNDDNIQILSPAPAMKEKRYIHQGMTIRLQGINIGIFNFRRGMLELVCPNYREKLFVGYLTNLFHVRIGIRFGQTTWVAERSLIITPAMQGDCAVNLWTDGLSATGRWITWNRKLTSSNFHVQYKSVSQQLPPGFKEVNRSTNATVTERETENSTLLRSSSQ